MNIPTDELISRVDMSISNALQGISKLDESILKIDGMSSTTIRHFLNNLGGQFPAANYLEIGCWKGSTLISAAYKNQLKRITAIDNFAEFGGPKTELLENIRKYKDQMSDLHFYEADSFRFSIKEIPEKIDIYFYDGDHHELCQKAAYTYYNEALSDTFITMVDDWSFDKVKNGTKQAFKELNYNVVKEWELTSPPNGIWWMGYYVAIVRK